MESGSRRGTAMVVRNESEDDRIQLPINESVLLLLSLVSRGCFAQKKDWGG